MSLTGLRIQHFLEIPGLANQLRFREDLVCVLSSPGVSGHGAQTTDTN
jgi:hypothetical protein